MGFTRPTTELTFALPPEVQTTKSRFAQQGF